MRPPELQQLLFVGPDGAMVSAVPERKGPGDSGAQAPGAPEQAPAPEPEPEVPP